MKPNDAFSDLAKEIIAFVKVIFPKIIESGNEDFALVLLVLHIIALIVWMTYATFKNAQNNPATIEVLRSILFLYTLALITATTFVWYLIW